MTIAESLKELRDRIELLSESIDEDAIVETYRTQLRRELADKRELLAVYEALVLATGFVEEVRDIVQTQEFYAEKRAIEVLGAVKERLERSD